jgi:hypothetical protein
MISANVPSRYCRPPTRVEMAVRLPVSHTVPNAQINVRKGRVSSAMRGQRLLFGDCQLVLVRMVGLPDHTSSKALVHVSRQ